MKKLLATTALGAGLVALTAPAFAAGTPSYGSVKLNWTVSTAATMTIATQYSAAGAQGLAAPSLLPSAAGVCSGTGTTETAFNVTYGALNPSLSASVGCLYQNAVSVSVTTNDSSGFVVNQYLDASPGTGVGFCAYANTAAGTFPITAATSVTQSTRSGNPAAGTFTGSNLTACAGSGQLVPVAAGGTLTNSGGGPGNPGGTEEYYAASTSKLNMVSNAAAATTAVFAGEDLQLNLESGAPSAANQTAIMTLQLIPN